MNPEIKRQWIDALRSGKYQQGTNYLRRDRLFSGESFCPLGVLGDIVDPSKWRRHLDPSLYGYKGNTVSLPREFCCSIGLDYNDHDHIQLINDNKKKSFDEIAEWIEENL